MLMFYFSLQKSPAHEGRAYLLFEHLDIGKNKVSVRVDPDNGNGTFEFFVDGHPAQEMTIELSASPVEQPAHVLKATAVLDKEASQRPGRLVFVAIVPFDKAVNWNVNMVFKQNEDTLFATNETIEVVEPGPNKKEFLLFFLPFLLVGFVGFKVFLAKRKQRPL